MKARRSWIPILALALAATASPALAREVYISPMFG
jgi:hypothetical protein